MNREAELERLEALLEEMKGGLDFYAKFVNTSNPKHKGIPYMSASETFSTNNLYTYGKFWRLFKKVAEESGLTNMWDSAAGYGGWVFHHRKAMGILFPRSPEKTKLVDDVPTLVPDKVVKDPERAKKALPYLQKMIDLIESDLNDMSTTLRGDLGIMSPGEDSIMESVMTRIWSEHAR